MALAYGVNRDRQTNIFPDAVSRHDFCVALNPGSQTSTISKRQPKRFGLRPQTRANFGLLDRKGYNP
jgi:hypothetical protein